MLSSSAKKSPYSGICLVVDQKREYIPLTSVQAHASILSTASQTKLTQTFRNPCNAQLDELRYVFPVYDGVSVVSFVCTVGDRVIHGVVKERQNARQTYDKAVASGHVAGLLEQSTDSTDVFTTKIGIVPAGAEIKVELTYLSELKHDAQMDGLRFTIPTSIMPRYGSSDMLQTIGDSNVTKEGGISVTIHVEMPDGSSIEAIQSPSHPISVQIGSTSSSLSDPTLRLASATLALDSSQLDKDFVLQVVATDLGKPSAILETHPSIPNQKALMVTLVPKLNLRVGKPEIVFVCDRSGSMRRNNKIQNLRNALTIFLRSLPVGVKFNICSFGAQHSFLWPRSQNYDQSSLEAAVQHVESFTANMGGTVMYEPLKATFERRYQDMDLEVFLMTDGGVGNAHRLFDLVKEQSADGRTRVFSLGVGNNASHSLVEGIARAGNGFAQTVLDGEKMEKKVVRMLKGALTPHVVDYFMEFNYGSPTEGSDDGFLLVEKCMDALDIRVVEPDTSKIIPLHTSTHEEIDISNMDASTDVKYAHLPTVPIPKLLQTPSAIPPLFSFIRATVYVLLSDDDAQVPETVTLRGMSPDGPVEQIIPVTELSREGTMIHQLAARKEIKELEEGRGWLSQAKDKANGRLLKEVYDGKLGDMVEREAVRLGLLYQVAGKWCSFVAVESETDNDWEEDCVIVEPQKSIHPSASGPRAASRGFCAKVPKPRSMPLTSSTRSMGAFSSTTSPGQGTSAERFAMSAAHREVSTAGNGTRNAGTSVIGPNVTKPSKWSLKGARVDPQPSVTKPVAEEHGQVDKDLLHRIASLQAFTGMWTWSAELEELTGVTKAASEQAAVDQGLDVSRGDVLSTLVAVLFLKKKLANEEEAWEMMVQKAVDWIKGALDCQEDYETWERAVADIYLKTP